MRRRAKPAKVKVEAKPPVARRSQKNEGSRVRDLEKRLAEALEREAEALRHESEALERETATAEILKVISGSPTDLQPVFDAVAESAARLCNSLDAHIFLRDGDFLRLVGHHGSIPIRFTIPVIRGTANGRAVLDGRTVHIVDMQTEVDEFPEGSENARRMGHRTVLNVPLMREGVAIGAIGVRHTEARLFTERQVALLQTFADQAVIALENVRLFKELEARNRDLTESLEQQTATSEILRVISSSPTDVQPVFDSLVASAARLCGANDLLLLIREANVLRTAAGVGSFWQSLTADFRVPLVRGTVAARSVIDGATLHFADLATLSEAEFPVGRDLQRRFGHHTVLAVPLMREGVALGTIFAMRFEVRPFVDQQVALLQTFADQAVIAIENVRLFRELEARNRDLMATSRILEVISSSPTDVQPAFEAIAQSARRLCDGDFCNVARYDGELVHLVAHAETQSEGLEVLQQTFPARPSRATAFGRTVLDGAVVHIPDTSADADYAQPLGQALHVRSALGVPLLRRGRVLGVIAIGRNEAHPFTDTQIQLLQTFADQAVIAIENVRLFTELQEKNRALTTAHAQVTEALEQQTATSEILRVIASSPTDLLPVLDAVSENASRLCEASDAVILLLEGTQLRTAAHHGQLFAAAVDRPATRDGVAGRAVLDRETIHLPDVFEAHDFPMAQQLSRADGSRTVLATPLMREGVAIGAILIRRGEVRPFSDNQVKLLQTFADQAVIAIENVRLFKELESRNKDLTEALDQQTATSEILRVISSSPTNVQPVFDTIVTSAGRLCGAESAVVYRFEEEMADAVALYNLNPDAIEAYHRRFPRRLRDTDYLWRVADGSVLNIADIANDPHTATNETFRSRDVHSFVLVPMVRDEQAIGAIRLSHHDVGAFSEERVRLLKTFAAQAVLAIENVRLLSELRARTAQLTRSVEELTALGEVSRALSSTLNLETVLRTIVLRANELAGTAGCTIWEYDEAREEFRLRASDYPDEADAAALQGVDRVTTIRKGVGVTTQVMERRQPVQVHDIVVEGAEENPIRRRLIEAGHHALLGVPLLSEDEVIGVLAVTRKSAGEFEPETVRLLSTFATQSALAIQNARLFREIEDKSRQLEMASQHKSEFLANMSHELRTPLNAIIGFSEVLGERMFGELNEKQAEYLQDIYASGTHLLSLINDILDLSKIEAGRMELEPTDFDLPQAIDNALTLVRERAGRREITLEHSMDERLGEIRGDERKVKQVLLNLLSNALKFTPEGGRVEVRAGMVDGMAEISVTDTGVGIAPADQEAVFEEFRQVGTADKKAEGTGLGLTLCRKFVELHGGRIWVKSQVGVGSTFSFTFPIRRGQGGFAAG